MTGPLDLRPPQRQIVAMTGVPTDITVTLLDEAGETLEATSVDLYVGGDTSDAWPLPDPLGDVVQITGVLNEDDTWTVSLPGLPDDEGAILLRWVIDGALVLRSIATVGSGGSVTPTTEITMRDTPGLVMHITTATSGGGGGGTVDSVARAAITSHTGETTAAHGGIVASTDPRLSDARTPTAHTHPWSEVTDKPLFGSAATADVGDFATATQGGKADTAVQPGDLATVATTGDYDDLTGRPTLGTAAAQPSTAFATAAQGAKADAAVPGTRTLAGLDLTANRDAASLRTALGVVSLPSLPIRTGSYYTLSGNEKASTTTHYLSGGAGRLVAMPVWLPAGTYDRIGVYCGTVGTAVWRFGVYPTDSTTLLPDGQSLVIDCGTIDMSATTGVVLATTSITIPTTGLYWLTVLVDAHTSTPSVAAWDGNTGATPSLPWQGRINFGNPAGRGRWARVKSGITTGAMPAVFPSAVGDDQAVQVLVRAA